MAEPNACVESRINWYQEERILANLRGFEMADDEPGFNKRELKAAQKFLSNYYSTQDTRPESDILCLPTSGVTSSSLLALMSDLERNVESNKNKVGYPKDAWRLLPPAIAIGSPITLPYSHK